jgi:malate dehydrogenase (oxaloacetate-decarboxylating)(NADP+)
MRERNYFAAMMVNEGEADALVTGHSRSYPSVVKPISSLKKHGARLLPLQT